MGNRNVLLVEGKDDLYVIAALLQHHLGIDKVKSIITIKDNEGFEKLLLSISGELRADGVECVGIVIDADHGRLHYDNTLETRLNRLQSALRSAVYHVLMGEKL